MSPSTLPEARPRPDTAPVAPAAAFAQETCAECLGTGGWYRYEPALEPAPGVLYLSCLQCRGSGRMVLPRGG